MFRINRKLFSLSFLSFLSLPLGVAEEARHLSWGGNTGPSEGLVGGVGVGA